MRLSPRSHRCSDSPRQCILALVPAALWREGTTRREGAATIEQSFGDDLTEGETGHALATSHEVEVSHSPPRQRINSRREDGRENRRDHLSIRRKRRGSSRAAAGRRRGPSPLNEEAERFGAPGQSARGSRDRATDHTDRPRSRPESGNARARATPVCCCAGCSDARVPIELIFNEGPNDLFVVRVAGNGLGGEVLGV